MSETRRMSKLVVVALVLGAAGGIAWADCTPEWLYGPGQGLPGTDGRVSATAMWDPDGPGPEPEQLVVGGEFTIAGDVIAHHIARWDGTNWQPLGTGMNDHVLALTVYNGELIAGGQFSTAGGVSAHGIARWSGTSWQPLGTGVNGTVRALAVYNGVVIAGGLFSTAGGVSAICIACWDGTTWQTLGTR